jgi:hypothetical protein
MNLVGTAIAEATADTRAPVADQPLRVTHVVLALDCGGMERVVLDLVREGKTLGQEPSVLCLERPGALAAQVEALGVPVVSLGKGPGVKPGLLTREGAAKSRRSGGTAPWE